jgi:hypothetical protein
MVSKIDVVADGLVGEFETVVTNVWVIRMGTPVANGFTRMFSRALLLILSHSLVGDLAVKIKMLCALTS